ncbi:hypothetical protein NA57DRAFT_57687 [Rhizodiscina lignyota]|uniref:Uncharacterized protein n=1 Tax=Rhizodiscina lignyota TaxID=1504668 RepID=A0A9P4IEJ7_9PEZI|nr:hypothetical protein NA57DRAFT_57687 [Rhizodiscina lignyota]
MAVTQLSFGSAPLRNTQSTEGQLYDIGRYDGVLEPGLGPSLTSTTHDRLSSDAATIYETDPASTNLTLKRSDLSVTLWSRASTPDNQKTADDWMNAGTDLQCLMERAAGQANSYFRDSMGNQETTENLNTHATPQTLEEGGWGRQVSSAAASMLADYAPCLKRLNIPMNWPATASVKYTNVGHRRPDGSMSGTMSTYWNSYDTNQGLIISWFVYSPQYYMQNPPAGVSHPELPEIQRWSDIAWVEWKGQCDNQINTIQKIKYFLVHDIQNEYWRELAKPKYFNPASESWAFPTWGQSTYVSTDDAFGKRMLASPIGRGPAWFLISNKDTLGKKEITGIRIFRHQGTTANTDTASMLLYVEDVTEGRKRLRYLDGSTRCVIL